MADGVLYSLPFGLGRYGFQRINEAFPCKRHSLAKVQHAAAHRIKESAVWNARAIALAVAKVTILQCRRR